LRSPADAKEVSEMTVEQKRDPLTEGAASYRRWKQESETDPEYQAGCGEEAAEKELWLQSVEARQEAGLTQTEVARRLGVSQAQVARIEKRGYDAYTLNTLRHYVQAPGGRFSLQVSIRQAPREDVGEAVADRRMP
jgi:hypothetical protein